MTPDPLEAPQAAALDRLGLVLIDPEKFHVDIDLIYARADNFTGAVIYDHPLCLLRPPAAEALARAALKANSWGMRLRVLDAFRSQRAQEALWAVAPYPGYVADPRRGSNHTRGVAVDVTLVDAQGRALDMGTPVDTMHADSHHFCAAHSTAVQINRMYLLTAMLESGFTHHPWEWWHYQLPNAHDYALITEDPLIEAHHPITGTSARP